MFGFQSKDNKVDPWLLKNLRILRERLEAGNVQKSKFVHALIGRSIFIRYLEDRRVLVEEYFSDASVSRFGNYQSYIEVLNNKADTYNLFKKLSNDFNADLFPSSAEEEYIISENDLHVLRDFLEGRSMGEQRDLFFWAYRFEIIPIELISSIYEEFYHEFDGKDDKGTHYTPMSLVNLVLSESLPPQRLDSGATVLDCACGSGVFLVEAFKRMVYHECKREHIGPTSLPRKRLEELLTERIVGIDVNTEAVQIAAFSLYLSFLDFREPPDIRGYKKLPKLIYDNDQGGKTLYCCNTFLPSSIEKKELKQKLQEQIFVKDEKKVLESVIDEQLLPLDDRKFDVIVGNPPWGSLKRNDNQLPVDWCKAFGYAVGDKELSQCFIWRTRHLLKPDGEIGLLVYWHIC